MVLHGNVRHSQLYGTEGFAVVLETEAVVKGSSTGRGIGGLIS